MAHDKDRVRIAAIPRGVVVGPSDRLCQIFRYLLHGHVWNKTVVGRDEHEAPVQERPRLGRRVKALRKKRGFSQEDMISFGFSARHWQQIEAGRPITLTTLLRICVVFRVPVYRLVKGLDEGST